MSAMSDGDQAFPGERHQHGEWNTGMSLREWFAGQAMTALISKLPLFNRGYGFPGIAATEEELAQVCSEVAKAAYAQADAMIQIGKG